MTGIVSINAVPCVQNAPVNALDENKVDAPPEKELDLSGALASQLADISMRFQEVLEAIAALGVKEQETVGAMIKSMGEVLNAVQKLEAGQFSKKEDLDQTLELSVFPPAVDRVMANIKAHAKEALELAKTKAELGERNDCAEVEKWEYANIDYFKKRYDFISKGLDLYKVESEVRDGKSFLRYWGVNELGQTIYKDIEVTGNFFWPSWAPNKIKDAYKAKTDAKAKAEADYKNTTGGITLRVALLALGICKKDEDLPKSKDQLKIASQKISDMISSLQSDQSLITSSVSGLNNSIQQQTTKVAELISDYFSAIQRLVESMH